MTDSTESTESTGTTTPPLPDGGHALGHGNSVAAWTAVAIILVGTLLAALAVIFTSVWLFVLGAVVVVVGALAGKLLAAMGFGATPSH